jgi:hypothetical protein
MILTAGRSSNMTQTPNRNIVEVKPAPTVYTVLLIIAIVALVASIGITGYRLTADPPTGYGLTVGDLLKSWDEIKPPDNPQLPPSRAGAGGRRG